MGKGRAGAGIAAGAWLLCALALPGFAPPGDLEPAFEDRLEAAATEAEQVELARWCVDKGWLREALIAVERCLEEHPDSREARALRHERPMGGGWVQRRLDPDALTAPRIDAASLAADRTRLLKDARDRSFRMARSAFRFEYWSDLETARVQEFVKVMNPYYDRMKTFFQVGVTKTGIPVILLATRSEYLAVYHRVTGASGEHSSGFFVPAGERSFLCFYDRPRDEQAVFGTARHETTHLLMDHALRGGECPHWIDEGLACYFAADGEERTGSYAAACFLVARQLSRDGRAPSLRELSEVPRSAFGFPEYALSWSWMSYLIGHRDTALSMRRLVSDLRELDAEAERFEWTVDDWERNGNRVFWNEVAPSEELQAGWADHVQQALAPETPSQCAQVASQALAYIEGRLAVRDELTARDRRELLRETEGWLERAAHTDDPLLAAEVRLAGLGAVMVRARLYDYTPEERSFAVTHVIEGLDALLASDQGPAVAGPLARAAATVLREAAPLEEHRETLREEELYQRRVDAGSDVYTDRLAEVKDRARPARTLIELVERAGLAALDHDPLDQGALLAWTHVLLEYEPTGVGRVHPHLLFQMQADPDDVNLGALAAVTAVAGAPQFADALMDRARAISMSPDGLDGYAEVVADARPPRIDHGDDCDLCDGSAWIACGRCEGGSRWEALCPLCDGKASIACGVCGGDKRTWCRNCGGEGKIHWKGGDSDRCKLCSKGEVNCFFCERKGSLTCVECQGDGRVTTNCDACFSMGGTPCPRAGDVKGPCPVCHRSQVMPCLPCLGQGGGEEYCDDCGGWGLLFCARCVGGKAACLGCHGTGRVRFVNADSGKKAGTSKCDHCRGKGHAPCGSCDESGVAPCAVKQPAAACATCRGRGLVTCAVCDG